MPNALTTTTADGGDYQGRYTSEAKCATFLGTILKAILGDATADDIEDAGTWRLCIESAEADVDLYSNGPHAVTAGTPKAHALEKRARHLACFEAYVRRGINDAKAGGDFDLLRKNAIDDLKLIASGAINLPDDAAGSTTGDDSLNYLRSLSPASGRPACGTVVRTCCDPFDRRL